MYVSITNIIKSVELYPFLLHTAIKPSDPERDNSSALSSYKNLRINIYFEVAKNSGLILIKPCLFLIKFPDLADTKA